MTTSVTQHSAPYYIIAKSGKSLLVLLVATDLMLTLHTHTLSLVGQTLHLHVLFSSRAYFFLFFF